MDVRRMLLVLVGLSFACDDGNLIDFGTSYGFGVPPEWLIGHEFIEEATDPDDHGQCYRYSDRSNDKPGAPGDRRTR